MGTAWPGMTSSEKAELRGAIAAAVKSMRLTRKLKQADVAHRLDWSRSTVGMIEAGLQAVTVEQLVDLARCFDCPVSAFLIYATSPQD